jgi:hypothetical protein
MEIYLFNVFKRFYDLICLRISIILKDKLKKINLKKNIKNRIEKNEDQDWYKKKMKSNYEGWNWKKIQSRKV